jgi:hypothetical protein
MYYYKKQTLIAWTRLAVAFATSFGDCAKCRRAIGFDVFEDASRAALHRTDVFFATVVANVKIYRTERKYESLWWLISVS